MRRALFIRLYRSSRDWRDKQDIDFDTSGTISIVIGGEDDDE